MRLQPRRVAVMFLSMLIVVGTLYGLQRWIFVSQTSNPLARALRHEADVQRVALDLTASPPTVTVTLHRVTDLMQTYRHIEQTINAYVPGARLEVLGRPDAKLQSAFETLSFPIEEGLATGNFLAMQGTVLRQAHRLGIGARLYIDAQNVYLALYDASHAAYYVYSRGGH